MPIIFFFNSIGFVCITFENCSLIWKDLCPVINPRGSDPKPSREEEEYIDFTRQKNPKGEEADRDKDQLGFCCHAISD